MCHLMEDVETTNFEIAVCDATHSAIKEMLLTFDALIFLFRCANPYALVHISIKQCSLVTFHIYWLTACVATHRVAFDLAGKVKVVLLDEPAHAGQ